MFLEFHEFVPSVFTVVHCEFDMALMSRFVMVTLSEYAMKVCLFLVSLATCLNHKLTKIEAGAMLNHLSEYSSLSKPLG